MNRSVKKRRGFSSVFLVGVFGVVLVAGLVQAEEARDCFFDPEYVQAQAEKVADWQFANEYAGVKRLKKMQDRKYLDWVYGPYVNGLVAMGQTTGDEHYIELATQIGDKTDWGVTSANGWIANNHATLQSWFELYEIQQDPKRIEASVKALDLYMENLADADDDLEFKKQNKGKWSWCDALYMSPPTFARAAKVTGNAKYRDFLHEWWWKASAFYYSPEHQLFFRDESFFDKKAPNGQPVFWCRGNGWVVGGLVRVLQYLEPNDPMRPKYEQELVAILTKLKTLQCDNNLWNPNLLDPSSPNQPDSSGSGLIVYAFAYAINEGLLPKGAFLPVIEKAWPALCAYVQEDGGFSGVQPIGDSPVNFDNKTAVPYGAGAFLLAASEVYKIEE